MKILVIADAVIPVPPVGYGGTERVVDMMCRGLVRHGHEVHLMAGPGSKDYGGGLTIHRAPTDAYPSRAFRKIWFQYLVMRAARGAKVVINHGRLDYLEALYRTDRPILHWLHNPLNGREADYVVSRRPSGDHFVGISHAQISANKAAGRFAVVYNAVDLETIPFCPAAASPPYLLFLGRLTRNKGVHLAIEVGRRAGMKLVIAGNVPRESDDPDYFETMVKPHLGPQCEWVGPYDSTRRNELLAGAGALIFPVQWMEPFGNVMVEAMAAGVPVIASRMASTPEVVAHGETGFLCASVEEMIAAVPLLKGISREKCRQRVAEHFSEPIHMAAVERLITTVLRKS